jgi:sigma-B regulation protein RsbU (phosphoserine phosphatase)
MIQTLPARQLWPLWGAVFSSFGVLGLILDILTRGRQPGLLLALNVIASGTFAVLYLLTTTPLRTSRFLVVLATHGLYSVIVPRAFNLLPDTPPGRLLLDALSIMTGVVIGYSMFLRFINMTAARYLRVEAEISVAREIHHGLVPDLDRRIGGFEFFGWSIASGAVGGDLVDLVEGPGGWLGYVADVSGHGVGSGVIMGMFKSALRMRARGAGSIGDLLGDVHAVLMPLKPAPTFVTVACLRGDGGDRLECAVAGHLPILRVRQGRVDEVTEPQLALGMFEETRFESCRVEAVRGDLFALLTDGLIEVFDHDNRELGFDWAKGVLAAEGERPLATIADRLLAGARAHGAQLDDQTILLIRRVE